MWYGGGDADHCDWAFAVSADGSHFDKRARLSHLGTFEDDHVVHDAARGVYRMYYWDCADEPNGLFCATSKDETHFDFEKAAPLRIEGEKYPGMYKFTHVVLDGGGTSGCTYGNFVRPHCPDGTVRLATSSDGLHWTCRNKNLLKGHDGEVSKLADRWSVSLCNGPQG